MNICGIFSPHVDTGLDFSFGLNKDTCCLRKKGHTGKHVFRQPDGVYVSWVNDWYCMCEKCLSEGSDHWCGLWDELDTVYAEELLEKEKPME